MTSIHSLAPETILQIVELGNSTTMRHCALVCREWRAPSQQALFRNVRVGDLGALDFINSEARSRHITVTLEYSGSQYASVLIKTCSNLIALRIHAMVDWSPVFTIKALASSYTPLVLRRVPHLTTEFQASST